MANKLKYLFGALLFSMMHHHIISAPSLESKPQNTIEKTIEYNKKDTPNTETPISRGDLFLNFSFKEYKVGDKFDYSGKIQNTNGSMITIDNRENKLEWILLREDEIFNIRKIDLDFSVIFKNKGFIRFNFIDDLVEIKTSNTKIYYNGKTHNIWYPLIGSLSINPGIPSYEFTEPGFYISQISSIYDLDGKKYKTIFESEEFEVKE